MATCATVHACNSACRRVLRTRLLSLTGYVTQRMSSAKFGRSYRTSSTVLSNARVKPPLTHSLTHSFPMHISFFKLFLDSSFSQPFSLVLRMGTSRYPATSVLYRDETGQNGDLCISDFPF